MAVADPARRPSGVNWLSRFPDHRFGTDAGPTVFTTVIHHRQLEVELFEHPLLGIEILVDPGIRPAGLGDVLEF